MNKWVYTVVGSAMVLFSIVLFSWFISDFAYGIMHITNPMYFARIFSPILCLYFGVFYLTYGIKSDKINKLSNLSLNVLAISLIVSVILLYSAPRSIGGPIPLYVQIMDSLGRIIMPLGIVSSFVLSILSIFKKSK